MSELITEQKLKEFGRDYVKILVRELKREGKDATGRLINSIDYRLREDANNIFIVIESVDYLKWVDEGRKRGTYPPIRPLIEWTRVKGLPKSAAYGIQKNIFKFGIKPTRVIQRVINEFENSPTLQRKYEDEVVEQIINMVEEKFNN
jgi:hypothetical protein